MKSIRSLLLFVVFFGVTVASDVQQKISDQKVEDAAQSFICKLFAVPGDEDPIDHIEGQWMFWLLLQKKRSIALSSGMNYAKNREVALHELDPQYQRWDFVNAGKKMNGLYDTAKKLGTMKELDECFEKRFKETMPRSIPSRMPVIYSNILRNLMGQHSIAQQDSERVLWDTNVRLADAIVSRLQRGSWYSEICPIPHAQGPVWYEETERKLTQYLQDEGLEQVTEYKTELWDWYKTEGVAEGTYERISASRVREMAMRTYKWYKTEGVAAGTHERISASGVREIAMRTYKAADSL